MPVDSCYSLAIRVHKVRGSLPVLGLLARCCLQAPLHLLDLFIETSKPLVSIHVLIRIALSTRAISHCLPAFFSYPPYVFFPYVLHTHDPHSKKDPSDSEEPDGVLRHRASAPCGEGPTPRLLRRGLFRRAAAPSSSVLQRSAPFRAPGSSTQANDWYRPGLLNTRPCAHGRTCASRP